MARHRMRQDWNYTASLMALMANCNRDPKKHRQPYSQDFFHPMPNDNPQRKQPIAKAPITALRDVFIDHKLPKVESDGGE